jgi:hypothetical protein
MNGYYHGFGIITYSNGDSYQGVWKKGLYHGKGVYMFCNETCLNNIIKYPNGSWYINR